MKRKKIVIITGNFPYGGASANLMRYFALALSLQKNDVEVLIPTGAIYGKKTDNNRNRAGKIGDVSYRHTGLINHPRHFLGKLIDNLFALIIPIFHLLNKTIWRKLDVIIVYNPSTLSMITYLTMKKILRKRLIVILPEFYEKPDTYQASHTPFQWYLFFFCIKYLVKYADKYIVLSEFLKQYINSRLNKNKDILIMPNLTDPERFNIKGILPFQQDKITIGYIGVPVKKDGVLDLIKSFGIINRKFPSTHLLIIGDITNGNSILPNLRKYLLELNIDPQSVTFTGLQSHTKIPELLLSCQILALTRPNGVFAEAGFPTKLGEYFACKKPVLITKVGDIPKYFVDNVHVKLVEPENIESIVSGFEYLLNNEIVRNQLSINGFKWMNENLNYIKQSKKISDFINNS